MRCIVEKDKMSIAKKIGYRGAKVYWYYWMGEIKKDIEWDEWVSWG